MHGTIMLSIQPVKIRYDRQVKMMERLTHVPLVGVDVGVGGAAFETFGCCWSPKDWNAMR